MILVFYGSYELHKLYKMHSKFKLTYKETTKMPKVHTTPMYFDEQEQRDFLAKFTTVATTKYKHVSHPHFLPATGPKVSKEDALKMLEEMKKNVKKCYADNFEVIETDISECSLKLKRFKPEFSMGDSNGFLLPILKWGPNNQISGFYESLHVAKALNRKLVLPPFFFHETDRCRNKKMPQVLGELRVNADSIENMVTLDQYKSVCPETSAVFVASDFKENEGLYTRILEFQTASGINLLMKGRKFKKGIKYYPDWGENRKSDILGNLTFDEYVRENWEKIGKEFGQEKCVVFVLPFRTVIQPSIEYLAEDKSAYDFPNFVLEVVERWLSEFGDFSLGVHWRYIRGDWSARCRSARKNTQPECRIMRTLDLGKLTEVLEKIAIGNSTDASTAVCESC